MHAIHDELTLTHNHLEKSNGLLMESVNYARKIQEALLPSPEALSDKMDEVAVCWQPLHVVSGDYYWMQEVDGRCVIVEYFALRIPPVRNRIPPVHGNDTTC